MRQSPVQAGERLRKKKAESWCRQRIPWRFTLAGSHPRLPSSVAALRSNSSPSPSRWRPARESRRGGRGGAGRLPRRHSQGPASIRLVRGLPGRPHWQGCALHALGDAGRRCLCSSLLSAMRIFASRGLKLCCWVPTASEGAGVWRRPRDPRRTTEVQAPDEASSAAPFCRELARHPALPWDLGPQVRRGESLMGEGGLLCLKRPWWMRKSPPFLTAPRRLRRLGYPPSLTNTKLNTAEDVLTCV